MDGWITIGTKLDTDKFDRQMSDLEHKIENEEKKQELLNQKTVQYTNELGKATDKVNDLAAQYDNARAKAEQLAAEIDRMKQSGAGAKILGPQMELEKQQQAMQELAAEIDKASTKQSNLSNKVEQTKMQYDNSQRAVIRLKGKIEEANVKAQQIQFKNLTKSINEVKSGITGAIARLGKMALAVLSIRSAYMLVRQASSTLAQYDKQYAANLEYIRYVIAQGIAPVLKKVVELAQTLMAYINYLAQRLFGVNLFANGSAAAFKSAKDSMSGMAKSSKEIKNNLAAFDEINVLDQETGSGAGAGAVGPSMDLGNLDDIEIPEWLKKLADILEPVVKTVKKIIQAIKDLKGNLSQLGQPFGQAFEKMRGILVTFWNQISKLGNPLKNWFQNDFLTFIQTFADTIREIISGLYDSLMIVTDTFFNSFLAPFISTLVEYILPVITGLATEITKTIGTLFNTINGLFQILWQEGVQPAVQLIMKIWDGAWKTIKDVWDKWGVPIFENIRAAITGVGELLETIWSTIIEPIWSNLIAAIDKLWSEHLQQLWANITNFIAQLTNSILDIWNNTLQPLLNWIVQTFGPIISTIVNTIVNIIGGAAGFIADVASGIINVLSGILGFMTDVFTGRWESAWDRVSRAMTKAWDYIVEGVKTAINTMIWLINAMIEAIESALNWLVEQVNNLRIENPFNGEEIWSPNLPTFSFGRIPYLAKGGIVAQPTHAIIGEAGREAVMPLDNNTEWMDALADKLNARSGEITIKFTGSTAQLVRMLKPELEKEEKRTGKRLIVGGTY